MGFNDEKVMYSFASGKKALVSMESNLLKRYDMHIHSTASDGTLDVPELVELARLSNVGTMAITDHDTITGSRELLTNRPDDLEVYSGVEMSVLVKHGVERIHILGYDFDINNPELNKALELANKWSIYNFKLYLKFLREEYKDIDIPEAEFDRILALSKNISRNDIAVLLEKYGYARDHQDAFSRYLNPIKYAVQENKKGFTAQKVISLLKNAGGIVSLAHPSSLHLGDEELDQRIAQYVDYGLDSIEVYHPKNKNQQRRYYLELAKKYGLLVSGGTDYHGLEIKPTTLMGSGINNNIDLRDNDLSLIKTLRKRH